MEKMLRDYVLPLYRRFELTCIVGKMAEGIAVGGSRRARRNRGMRPGCHSSSEGRVAGLGWWLFYSIASPLILPHSMVNERSIMAAARVLSLFSRVPQSGRLDSW